MSCFGDDLVSAEPEKVRVAVDTATEILWALTGRIFGVCDRDVIIEEPMCRPCTPFDAGCNAVFLPPPIYEVQKVFDAAGKELDFKITAYGCDVVGTPHTVRYGKGLPVPQAAAYMVGRLAHQRYLQCVGDDRCQLPDGTTSITRQGVTVQMADSIQVISAGLTGLTDVDAWIYSVNPHRMHSPAEVIG